ncbi:MAG TPA: phosphatidylglycerol lysyltransferase domain-containing protein [Acidimicrobiales bacterium]|nr:phosphatidylglycerol lysyltransferase domain-containing protein [Acidimicrobiales bacterium]
MVIRGPRRARSGPTVFGATRPVLARLTAAAMAALGVLLVAQAATGGPGGNVARMLRDLHFYVPSAAPGTVVLAGAAFLLVGRGLWLRRSNARWVALALLAADTLAAVRSGPGALPGLGAVLLAGLVVVTGGEYDVPRAHDVTPAFAKLLALTAAVDLVAGTVLVALVRAVPRPYAHPTTVGWVVIDGLTGRHAGLYGVALGERWLLPLLTAAGGLTLFVLLAALLAVPTAPLDGTRPRRSLAKLLSDRRDGDTLDPFVLRTDKLHYLATPVSSGDSGTSGGDPAVVGYRPIFGVALASGRPLGARAAAGEALAGYLDHCRRHGWRPCIIGLDEEAAGICRGLGMHTICIGDEAVLDVEGFRLDVPSMRNVRQAVKRSHNFGVSTAILREGDLSEELRHQLVAVSGAGRGTVPERGFSMGLGEPFDGSFPDCVVAVAFAADGPAIGFQRYGPCKGGAALSLDVMRRVPGSPNGVNERLISDVVGWARDHGVEEVSLNFAAFRALIDLGPDRNQLQRLEYWLVHRLDRWVKVESLYRFNAKFRPRWFPRYAAFGSYTDLGWVGLAALTAEFSLRVDRFSVRSTPDWLPALGHSS